MERPDLRRLGPFRHSIEARLRLPAFLELAEALPRARPKLVDVTELDRRGRTRLGTGGRHIILQPVVAERALVGGPRFELPALWGAVDDAEGAGWDAETTTVADVLLDVHRVGFSTGSR